MSDADALVRHLRGCCRGVLASGGTVEPVLLAINPATGVLVLNAPTMFEIQEGCTLHTPDEGDDAAALLIELVVTEPSRDPTCDRLLGLHGRAEHRGWYRATIDSAKLRGVFVSGDALSLAHGMLDLERRLCKASASFGGPRIVGVDPCGIWVRGRTGPMRLDLGFIADSEEPLISLAARHLGTTP